MVNAVIEPKTKTKKDYRISKRAATDQVRHDLYKSSRKTSREADLALRKIEQADTFASVGAKFLARLAEVDDDALREIAKTKPTALAIVAGICGQNLERLTAKPFSPTTINIDLSSAADVARKASGRDKLMRDLQAKIAELQEQVRQNAIQPIVVDAKTTEHNQPVLDAKSEVVDKQ